MVERTIRLLKENGIHDIAISTDIERYNYLGVQILKNKNKYVHDKFGHVKKSENCWLTAYYPLEENTCYLAGDVYWTEEAIETIINTKETKFICAPNIEDGRKNPSIKGREPLGYIVYNQKVFRQAINDLMKEIDEGKFKYDPIAWNLYRKLNNLPVDYNGLGNNIFKTKGEYIVIDDLTTDIDCEPDIPRQEKLLKIKRGEFNMVKVEVIESFTLGKYDEISKSLVRKGAEERGKLFVGDIFECNKEMAEYLTGKNRLNRPFVKIIEIIPDEVKEEKPVVEKPVKKTTRKTTKKTIAK